MITIIIASTISILFPISCSRIDAGHLNRGHYFKNHKSRVIQRGLVFILFGLIHPLLTIVSICMFWSVFDQSLNILRGKDFWYIGSTANSDKISAKYPEIYKASKFISLIVGLTILIITLWGNTQ